MIHNYQHDTDPAMNEQLTKKFFIKSEYNFHYDSTNKNRSHNGPCKNEYRSLRTFFQ